MQKQKKHTIAESLILPCAVELCKAVLDEKAAIEIQKVPLSNDSIKRRIDDMAVDVERQLILKIQKADGYSLQLDESVDITNKAQLLCYVRYMGDKNFEEEMLFCKALETHTRALDLFNTVNDYLIKNGLNWDSCISISTDGAAAMTGKRSGFITCVQEKNHRVVGIHCIIHREALASKSMQGHLNCVFLTAVKIVNFIKARALNSRLFTTPCEEMGAEHTQLFLHTEVRWLSRGRVFTRLFELREELQIFLEGTKSELPKSVKNLEFVSLLAYLADIFDKLNNLNSSLQGSNVTILDLTDKALAFVRKIGIWISGVEEMDFSLFRNFKEYTDQCGTEQFMYKLRDVINEHLVALDGNFRYYFNDMIENVKQYDWLRNPFLCEESVVSHLPFSTQEEFVELRSDRTLELNFKNQALVDFWVGIQNEFPELFTKARLLLLQFPTTYLCESSFLAMVIIKTKNRNRIALEGDLRLALTKIMPDIQALCDQRQAQVSH